jgi:putative transposase
VPQYRDGRFSTELFERYQRSEKALVAALAEMYLQGVSTRKVKAITEELCDHIFSASAISAINTNLDEGLAEFAGRRLAEACPYLIVDARYERVREAGVIHSQAVLLAIGIGWDGRSSVLAVELANRESRSSWRDLPSGSGDGGQLITPDHAPPFHAVRTLSDDVAGAEAIQEQIASGASRARRSLCRSHPARADDGSAYCGRGT